MSTWSGETLRLFIESTIRKLPNNNKQHLLFGGDTVSRLSDDDKRAINFAI